MKEMSLQFSEADREVVAICSNCNHNRARFLYVIEPMHGIAECNNCSHAVHIQFLRNSKFSKFEKDNTNI